MKEAEMDVASSRTQWTAVMALVGVNALWGLSFPIMKSLSMQMEQFFDLDNDSVPGLLSVAYSSGMIAIRFLLSLMALIVVCPRLVWKANRAEWFAGFLIGLLFYLGLILQVMGLATIPASRSGFLTSLTAVFTPVFSAVFFRRSISANVLIGVAIALVGVAILTGLVFLDANGIGIAPDAAGKWTVGDTLTTVGAVLFTGQLLMLDYYGNKINSTAITPGMFAAVVLAATVTFLSIHSTSLASIPKHAGTAWLSWSTLFASPIFIGLVLFLALFCSVFAFLGMNKFQPHVSAVQASIIYSSEPVFASFWALFLPWILGSIDSKMGYPNEVLTASMLIGGSLILLANVVSLWPRRA
jgi:drug/metabolite transporter (DMT)-like permease